MTDAKLNLSEDEQRALVAFFQEFQSAYLLDLSAFHDRLREIPDLPEDVLIEYTRLYKVIKMGWEQTANDLQGDEGYRTHV